eukprot:Colp12_sorted_trinity150504_noHs@1723
MCVCVCVCPYVYDGPRDYYVSHSQWGLCLFLSYFSSLLSSFVSLLDLTATVLNASSLVRVKWCFYARRLARGVSKDKTHIRTRGRARQDTSRVVLCVTSLNTHTHNRTQTHIHTKTHREKDTHTRTHTHTHTQLAKTLPKEQNIVVCVSGRGDKDMESVRKVIHNYNI